MPEIAKTDRRSRHQSNIFNGKYIVEKGIGVGKTAKVYLVSDIDDPDKKLALKLIRFKYLVKDERNVNNVEREIEILRAISNENVIKIHEYGSDGCMVKSNGETVKNCVYILTEYIEGGNLYDKLKSEETIDQDETRHIMTQIFSCLKHLHSHGVVHRDIKLENILLDKDLNLKLADFGFASYDHISLLKDYKGTPIYMAPEIKNQVPYDGRKADVFAAGVIFFSVIYGIFPFQNATMEDEFYFLICTE